METCIAVQGSPKELLSKIRITFPAEFSKLNGNNCLQYVGVYKAFILYLQRYFVRQPFFF